MFLCCVIHDLGNHRPEFGHILYWQSLPIIPTCFILLVRQNQKSEFKNPVIYTVNAPKRSWFEDTLTCCKERNHWVQDGCNCSTHLAYKSIQLKITDWKQSWQKFSSNVRLWLLKYVNAVACSLSQCRNVTTEPFFHREMSVYVGGVHVYCDLKIWEWLPNIQHTFIAPYDPLINHSDCRIESICINKGKGTVWGCSEVRLCTVQSKYCRPFLFDRFNICNINKSKTKDHELRCM